MRGGWIRTGRTEGWSVGFLDGLDGVYDGLTMIKDSLMGMRRGEEGEGTQVRFPRRAPLPARPTTALPSLRTTTMNRGAPPPRNLPARPANTNRPRDPPPPPQKVDREKVRSSPPPLLHQRVRTHRRRTDELLRTLQTCPFLIRTFVHPNSHHNVSDFTPTSTPTRDEHQLYTWYAPILLYPSSR